MRWAQGQEGGRSATERGTGFIEEPAASGGLGWAIVLLNLVIVLSVVRTLDYLNVPASRWIGGLAHRAHLVR